MTAPERHSNSFQARHVYIFLAYAAIVLFADAMAAIHSNFLFPWRRLHHSIGGFDLFKFVTWFVIPFIATFRWRDRGWFGVARWKRSDVFILAGLAAIGIAAVLLIRYVPGLRGYYPSMASYPADAKWAAFYFNLAWWTSWLPGWEYLHRYVILRATAAKWPVWGWVLVPVYEAVYHLQKHPLEMAGMFALGVVLTFWARKRENILLPFLAHALIEIELLAFLLLV